MMCLCCGAGEMSSSFVRFMRYWRADIESWLSRGVMTRIPAVPSAEDEYSFDISPGDVFLITSSVARRRGGVDKGVGIITSMIDDRNIEVMWTESDDEPDQ